MKHLWIIAILIFLSLSSHVPVRAAGRIYYVDSINGSNANNGLSPQTAFKSAGRLNRINFEPGDQVLFKRGQVFTIPKFLGLAVDDSGTRTAPVVISAYGNGDKPILRSTSTDITLTTIYVQANFIHFIDIKVENAPLQAIKLIGRKNKVIDVEISGSSIGVNIVGNNNVVRNLYVHSPRMLINDPAPYNDSGAVGVAISDGSRKAKVLESIFVGMIAPSYDYGTDGAAIEIYNGANEAHIAYNYVVGCDNFTEIGSSNFAAVSNIYYRYNLVVDCRSVGVFHVAGGNSGWDSPTTGIYLENNTFVNNSRSFWISDDHFGYPTPDSFFVHNNIFVMDDLAKWPFDNAGNYTRQNNIYFSNVTGSTNIGFNLNPSERFVNPALVDIGTKNYRLTSGSPALNSAVSLGFNRDFAGNIIRDTPDIGAFEFYMPSSNSVELLKNRSFENDDTSWQLLNGAASVCDNLVYDGNCALFLPADGVVTQNLTKTDIPSGSTLTFKAMVRNDTFSPKVKAILMVTFKDGHKLNLPVRLENKVRGVYLEFKGKFVLPAHKLQWAKLKLKSSTPVFFDNLSLTAS